MIFFSCNDFSKLKGLDTMKTVDYVDLKRYMGDWYVIANIKNAICHVFYTNIKTGNHININIIQNFCVS